MPTEWLRSFLETMIEMTEEVEGAGVEAKAAGLETAEVHRHLMMVEEDEAAVDMEGVGMMDVATMVDRVAAGRGMDAKAIISRDTVVGAEVATNKSEATTAAGNGLLRGRITSY